MPGSNNPVGLTTCSAITVDTSNSNFAGVADTKIHWFNFSENSSNLRGLLSRADGKRKPKSTSVVLRDLSPLYIAPIWLTVTCDSSKIIKESSGI